MEYISLVVGGVFTVLWYLLKQKDEMQAEQIKTLFIKHDQDAAGLEALKLKIAENHYPKGELDVKFHSLEQATREGFKDLGGKFDRLSEALLHIKHTSNDFIGKE